MNEIDLLDAAGPEASPLTPAVLSRARAALLAEIGVADEPASVVAARQLAEEARTRRSVRRRPSRRTLVRAGAAAVAVAAALTTAVLVRGSDVAAPPPSQVAPAGPVTLVDFALPAFPFTLPMPPADTDGPEFGASAGGGTFMGYENVADPTENLGISVSSEPPPPGGSFSYPGAVPQDVAVNGATGVLVTTPDGEEFAFTSLDWERQPGQWVRIQASGRYADPDQVLSIASSLVDLPQAVPVQLRLAPAGYSLDTVKGNGQTVILYDDADPNQRLIVRFPFDEETDPLQQLPDVLSGAAGPVTDVVVQGQPAQIVRTNQSLATSPEGWFLQAQFPDGTIFVVEASVSLTQDQVVEIADQVSYTP